LNQPAHWLGPLEQARLRPCCRQGALARFLTSAKQAHTFLEDRRIARPPGNSHLRHALGGRDPGLTDLDRKPLRRPARGPRALLSRTLANELARRPEEFRIQVPAADTG
jgi:hypothetical protein